MTPFGASALADGRRRDLVLFTAVAFAVSWVAWFVAAGLGGSAMSAPTVVPYLLGAFGPLVAALVVRIRRIRRGEPVPEHVVRFGPKTLLWAPLLLVVTSATVLVAALLAHVAGAPAPSPDAAGDTMSAAGGPVGFLVGMVISGPLSEEPGWRGTAHPRLRAEMGRFRAGVLLGVVWSVWHLPLFVIDGTVQNDLGLGTPSGVLFAVSAVPMALMAAYAYERAGIVASIAVHFAANTTMVLLGVRDAVTLAMIVGIQGLVAVLLLVTMRPAGGSASAASPAPADQAAARV